MELLIAIVVGYVMLLFVCSVVKKEKKEKRKQAHREWIKSIENDDVCLPWSVECPGACPLPNPRLTIELVPQTAWFSNVRSHVSKEEWDVIRKACYRKAGYRCEICGGKGEAHPVECHEIWHYDDNTHKQTLKDFIALCPHCHKVKHAGLAQVNGEIEIVLQQLASVNKIQREEAQKYFDWAMKQWEHRSQYDWKTDISLINK
ncbi:MAG: hypothetical protein LBK47_03985 [Prevotellaceae bacterium]|jgi:hypothetical protein|nr:hypothetical protein [Prevotellaceae bacterium]